MILWNGILCEYIWIRLEIASKRPCELVNTIPKDQYKNGMNR